MAILYMRNGSLLFLDSTKEGGGRAPLHASRRYSAADLRRLRATNPRGWAPRLPVAHAQPGRTLCTP